MTILMKNRNRLALESPQRTVLDSLTGFRLAVALLVLLLATKADAQSVFPCNNDMYILRANPANAAQTLIEKLTIVSNTPTLTSLFTFNYQLNALAYYNGYLYCMDNVRTAMFSLQRRLQAASEGDLWLG